MTDPVALALAFAYVSLILAVAEGLRRGFGLSVDFTRKFVHVGVGMIAFALVFFFSDWYWAIIPPLVFILVNWVSYRRHVFRGIETGDSGQLGTIYFPISFSLLIPLLWHQPALLVASLMPLTWGDAFAAALGSRYGRHPYRFFGQRRTIEGSLAMFVFSGVATSLALVVFGIPAETALVLALGASVAATLVEAVSPFGMDNLSVPIVSALVLSITHSLLMK